MLLQKRDDLGEELTREVAARQHAAALIEGAVLGIAEDLPILEAFQVEAAIEEDALQLDGNHERLGQQARQFFGRNEIAGEKSRREEQ